MLTEIVCIFQLSGFSLNGELLMDSLGSETAFSDIPVAEGISG